MIRRGRTSNGRNQVVNPGAWIRVPVPGDPQKLEMQVGSLARVAAFIDRERGTGGYGSVAALRCPDLIPGDYMVRVYGADEPVTTEITVT